MYSILIKLQINSSCSCWSICFTFIISSTKTAILVYLFWVLVLIKWIIASFDKNWNDCSFDNETSLIINLVKFNNCWLGFEKELIKNKSNKILISSYNSTIQHFTSRFKYFWKFYFFKFINFSYYIKVYFLLLFVYIKANSYHNR